MRNFVISFFIVINVFAFSSAAKKEGKAFSLFSVVTFKNEPCVSTSGTTGSGVNRNGTCYTSTECDEKGGTSSGNCASGFGVCCLFTLGSTTASGTTISQNNTYIQNPSFPAVYSDSSAITYTINKCADNICAVRLDFETFVTVAPTKTDESTACNDKFRSETSTSGNSPYICGTNTGQHMYVYLGPDASQTASLKHEFTGTSTIRQWEIKVSQIECGATYLPPDGCLQYHTGLSGRLKSFNFDETTTASRVHLPSQEYQICIRQESGMCCNKYSLCAAETSPWTLHSATAAATGLTGSDCTEDFLIIPGVSSECGSTSLTSRLCGTTFTASNSGAVTGSITTGTACDCTPPFAVGVITNSAADASATSVATTAGYNRGFCLEYTQVPCT